MLEKLQKNAFAMKDPKVGDTCWFLMPRTEEVILGTIRALPEGEPPVATVTCGYHGGSVMNILREDLCPTQSDAKSLRDYLHYERFQAYKAEMPDLESCLRFARNHPVACCEDTDWIAQEAYEVRVEELLGKPDFWQ